MHAPVRLRCEYLTDPVGIDIANPLLQWNLVHEQGQPEPEQAQVVVARSDSAIFSLMSGAQNGGVVWDSGQVTVEMPSLLYDGPALDSSSVYSWCVRAVHAEEMGPWSTIAHFTTGLFGSEDWQAQWITAPAWTSYVETGLGHTPQFEEVHARYFAKEFSVREAVRHATVFVCGLGTFELRLNGKKVGDHLLDPAQSMYENRSLYVAFDITDDVLGGTTNAFGLILGNGRFVKAYGYDRPKLILQAVIEYADGTRETVASDTSWRCGEGPIQQNGLYYGEVYDARLDQPGWDTVGQKRSGWDEAVEAPPEPLRAQLVQPIRVTETHEALSMWQISPGVYVYDFGQNMSGIVRLSVRAPRGTRIELRPVEILHDDGTPNRTTLRGARATDVYIAAGTGAEDWVPRFTYHGFRFVELRGYPGAPSLATLTALTIHSDVPPAGQLALGDATLQALHRNTVWGQRSNLMSIPTDCPQRDERQGWLGDIQLAAEEASYNFDMARFFLKYVDDIRDSQKEDGALSDVVPPFWPLYPADPAWGTAYLQLVWYIYWYYGDLRPVADHFDSMKLYVDFLAAKANGHLVRDLGKYGDWCPPGSIFPKRTPSELTNTWYYYHDTLLLSRMAAALGRSELSGSYLKRSEQIKAAFNREFLKDHGYATLPMMGRDATPGQTSNVLPLFLDMVPEESRPLVESKLMESIVKHQDMHLDTGIVGTRYIFDVLTSMGKADTAFRIATQKTYPGWGYMFREGATTLWERWECLTGAGMNSHNHIMLGSVDAWLYRGLAGLECTAPGWKRMRVAPHPVAGLPWASANVETVLGHASVSWVREETAFTLTVEVPQGSTAEVVLPPDLVGEGATIHENGKALDAKAIGTAALSRGPGYYRYDVVR